MQINNSLLYLNSNIYTYLNRKLGPFRRLSIRFHGTQLQRCQCWHSGRVFSSQQVLADRQLCFTTLRCLRIPFFFFTAASQEVGRLKPSAFSTTCHNRSALNAALVCLSWTSHWNICTFSLSRIVFFTNSVHFINIVPNQFNIKGARC